MKKNITLCLSLMILVLVCCGITINLVQKADKSPEFTFEQPYKVLHPEKCGSTINGETFEYEISNVRKWTITGPVYGRITKIYENGQLTSETHMKVSRQEVMW